MTFDDAIVNEVLPHFKDEQSLLKWMKVSMEHLMLEYAAQFKSPVVDGKHLLSKLNALPDTPESFLQLGGILGRQRKSFSWEELRDDANSERLLAEHDKAKVQKAMVRDSLTRAFDELHSGRVHYDARKLFAE